MTHRLVLALLLLFGLVFSAHAAAPLSGRFVVAVEQKGHIYVYDIAAGHKQVRSFLPVDTVNEVRGVCASAASGLLYVAYLGEKREGFILAVDIRSRKIVWNKGYTQSVDRMTCAPDGTRLYVPSNEFLRTPNIMVVDGLTGESLQFIAIPKRSHDALMNRAGTRVYVETKSNRMMQVIDVATGQVSEIGPLAGIPGPFTFDAAETRLFANVFGLNGFQIVDIKTGASLEQVTIPGQTPGSGGPKGFLQNHGIGLTPAGHEIWVADGPATGGSTVHVFDVTKSPSTRVATVDVEVPCPHWLTFSIKGDFAYIAGPHRSQREKPEGLCEQIEGLPTAVVDTATRQVVAQIAASDGYVLEVVMDQGRLVAVGDQYGVGR
jgi:DNA-binding beta-propeller fold protein YncE